MAQHALGDARELVGQCDGELVPVQPLRRRLEPCAEAISGPIVRAHQQDLRRLKISPHTWSHVLSGRDYQGKHPEKFHLGKFLSIREPADALSRQVILRRVPTSRPQK